jgi:hypothetical protein
MICLHFSFLPAFSRSGRCFKYYLFVPFSYLLGCFGVAVLTLTFCVFMLLLSSQWLSYLSVSSVAAKGEVATTTGKYKGDACGVPFTLVFILVWVLQAALRERAFRGIAH